MVTAIIGTGIAAKSAAETLLPRMGASDRLILAADEEDLFYSRVFLPDYCAGEIERTDLFLPREKLLGDERVRLVSAAVADVDARTSELLFSKLPPVRFDTLIVASGSSARRLDVDNADAAGVHCLRTAADADAIRDEAAGAGPCVVVGGGLVGLKAAWALRQLGKEVTVLVESERALSRVADQATSEMLARSFQARGIRFRFRSAVRALEVKRARVSAVALSDGSRIPARLVIVAKGVRPNLGFLERSGIRTRDGVVVDSFMRSSHPDILAAGDAAEVEDRLSGRSRIFALWPHAAEQGRIAARAALGDTQKYTGGMAMNSVVFYGRPYVFLGDAAQPPASGCRVYTYDGDGVHRRIVVRDGVLVGAVLAGSIDCAGMVCWDMRSGRRIDDPQAYAAQDGLVGALLSRTERPLCFSAQAGTAGERGTAWEAMSTGTRP